MSTPGEETQSDAELLLKLAINHASSQSKEGPWYGVYDLLLRSLCGVDRGKSSKTATIMFPQHPVTVTVPELGDDFDDSWLSDLGAHIVTPTQQHFNQTPSIFESPDPLLLTRTDNDISRVHKIGKLDPRDTVTPTKKHFNQTPSIFESPNPLLLTRTDSDISPVHKIGKLNPRDTVTPTKKHFNQTAPIFESPNPLLLTRTDSDISRVHRIGELDPQDTVTVIHQSSSPDPISKYNDIDSPMPGLALADEFLRQLKRRRTSDPEESLSPIQGHAPFPIPTSTSPLLSAADAQSIHNGVQKALELRATQIPDFLRIVFLVTQNPVIKRIDLVLEIKARNDDRDIHLANLAFQTFKQAQYVLSNDSSVQVVGCLMAIGEYWVYRELPRAIAEINRMEEQIRDARNKDTTYSPSPEPTNSSSSYARESSPPSYPFEIDQDTESEAFLALQEAFPKASSMISITHEATPKLLGMVKTRMKEINPDLWPKD